MMHETPENCVKMNALQLTLREMQAKFTNIRTYGVIVAVICVLSISAPFGTDEDFSLIGRFGYWFSIVGLSYVAASFFGVLAASSLAVKGAPQVWRYVVAAPASGICACLVVLGVNALVFGADAMKGARLLSIFMNTMVIAAAVTSVFALLSKNTPVENKRISTLGGETDPPRLLLRLPIEKRGKLLSLSVRDHYVDVVTSRGKEMLLMRLKDAIDETAPVKGLQVHRSYWVALSAVTKVERDGGRLVIITRADDRLPISRTYLPAVREAGIMPK